MATIQANKLPAEGSRVMSKSGMGGNVKLKGTVLCHVTDRWGTHALALMDNGTTQKIHSLTTVGIGIYQL